MASPTEQASVECNTGFSSVANFFSGMSAYLTSGGTPPDFSTVLSVLGGEELLTYAKSQVENRASFQAGSSSEASSIFAAFRREEDIFRMGKVDLINSAIADLNGEADFYNQTGQFLSGVLKGSPSTGSLS